jgi:hypothetical protein
VNLYVLLVVPPFIWWLSSPPFSPCSFFVPLLRTPSFPFYRFKEKVAQAAAFGTRALPQRPLDPPVEPTGRLPSTEGS